MSNMQFVPVPPPEEAPVQSKADALGLPLGLRAEERRDMFRCNQCSQMKEPGSILVWVPDSVRRGDPEWSVTEAARRSAYNGGWSGWCLRCAKKLSAQAPASSAAATAEEETPYIAIACAVIFCFFVLFAITGAL